MPKKDERIVAQFIWGLQIYKNEEGAGRVEQSVQNIGVPEEIEIMRLKKYLNKIEKEYDSK